MTKLSNCLPSNILYPCGKFTVFMKYFSTGRKPLPVAGKGYGKTSLDIRTNHRQKAARSASYFDNSRQDVALQFRPDTFTRDYVNLESNCGVKLKRSISIRPCPQLFSPHDHQFPLKQRLVQGIVDHIKIEPGPDRLAALVSGVPEPRRLVAYGKAQVLARFFGIIYGQ